MQHTTNITKHASLRAHLISDIHIYMKISQVRTNSFCVDCNRQIPNLFSVMEQTASGSFTVAQNLLAEKAVNALYKIRKQINFSGLPFSSAQKIFETAIEPILTYGSEVWGVFLKLDFEKWDKTSAEKAHLRFCKMFLGLNRKSSNHATRAEMGRFPIHLTIIKFILKYYMYLNTKEETSVAKQALYISKETSSKLSNSYNNNIVEILKFGNYIIVTIYEIQKLFPMKLLVI